MSPRGESVLVTTRPTRAGGGFAGLPYVKVIDSFAGPLRRWLAFGILRATAKRLRLDTSKIDALRTSQARVDARFGGNSPGLRIVPVREAGVSADWMETADSRPERVLLFIHGGAFMLRYPRTHAAMIAPWCKSLRMRAFMVDYRLAPEHPYPAAADDCHAAYRWLLQTGYDPRQIVLAGDSAGANLVLVTLHAIAQAGEPMPSCAVLLSPVADLTLSGSTFKTHARRDPILHVPTLMRMRAHYIRSDQLLDARASPLFGGFRDLPPLLIQVGSEEVLLDDALRVAARAHEAGVEVELEVWKRMAHVFQAIRMLPQARAAGKRIVAFISRHTRWAE
jgi:acetyl esterase/lipase